MSIIRMYLTVDDAQRPSHYREAWWEQDASEFVLHHGKVGEAGTTKVETVWDQDEANGLLATFAEQSLADNYVAAEDVAHEKFTVVIAQKGSKPTTVEETNAEKFAVTYTALLAWRGLGVVDDWDAVPNQGMFRFEVSAVHRSKAMKLASEALKKTDFRADRMKLERS